METNNKQRNNHINLLHFHPRVDVSLLLDHVQEHIFHNNGNNSGISVDDTHEHILTKPVWTISADAPFAAFQHSFWFNKFQ